MKKVISLLLTLLVAVSLGMTALAADFADVDSGTWYSDAVNYVVSNNLMGGYSDTSFGPNDNLSRAMVVQVLYNKEGKPAISGKADFTDVAADQWYNSAVTWGTQKGVMGGYGNGKFGPDDSVTLEQLAVILWNYSGNPTFTASADSVGAHSSWAANGLAWAVENSILTNVPYEAVTARATRAQTAQMLTNYLTGNAGAQVGIAVTSVALDIAAHKMGEGHTQTLKATVSPADATNTAITWSSSDPEIATVDQNGNVTGVSGGIATITATSANGKTATCTVDIWHSHKLTSSKPVTCTDGGVDVYTCSGCGHSYESWTPAPGTPHTWKAATCSTPKTCTTCGTTTGDPANHKWTAATCTAPNTCSACKATDGASLGHSKGNDGKCTRCGKVDFSSYVAPTKQEYVSGNYRSMPVVEINSVGGIKVKWEAKYLGEKTISYYTVYMTLMDPFGTPIKDEISGKSQISCRVLGPVKKNENLLLYNVVGYNGNCNVVKITKIKLEFTDGTSVEGDYSFLIRSFNPRYDGF